MVKIINEAHPYGILEFYLFINGLHLSHYRSADLMLFSDNLDRLHRAWSVLASWAYRKMGLRMGQFELIVNFVRNRLYFSDLVRKEGKE